MPTIKEELNQTGQYKTEHAIFQPSKNGLWIRFKNGSPLEFITKGEFERIMENINEISE